MRGAVVGSGVAHLAVIAGLLVVRQRGTIVVPGPDVVQVALLEPEAATPAPRVAPPPPPPKPAPAPAVKPEVAKGVRLEPPKKPKPAVAEPTPPKAPAPRPAAEAQLPYASVGAPGLKEQVAVDTPDFEFTYYLLLIRNKIAQNWTPPSGLASGAAAAHAIVYFRVGRGGDVTGVQLETGSGIDFFDRTAVRAVILSDPLPPLPLAYTGADLGVHVGFEYAGP